MFISSSMKSGLTNKLKNKWKTIKRKKLFGL